MAEFLALIRDMHGDGQVKELLYQLFDNELKHACGESHSDPPLALMSGLGSKLQDSINAAFVDKFAGLALRTIEDLSTPSLDEVQRGLLISSFIASVTFFGCLRQYCPAIDASTPWQNVVSAGCSNSCTKISSAIQGWALPEDDEDDEYSRSPTGPRDIDGDQPVCDGAPGEQPVSDGASGAFTWWHSQDPGMSVFPKARGASFSTIAEFWVIIMQFNGS